ncbi:hypothetical protein D3C87_1288830 [compost metagenome]
MSEWVKPETEALIRRPRRSKARLVRRLMVPAGALASTSALTVLEISMASMLLSDTCSKLKEREVEEPALASAAAMLTPLTVIEAYSGGRPRRRT